MARHRQDIDGSQYLGHIDLTGLRPATIEELAAQERAKPAPPRRGRRPLLIAVATAVLLVAGAGAFALARTGPQPTMVKPYGDAAPFGVGFEDGFGEHSPKPSPSQKPRVVVTQKPRTTAPPTRESPVMPPSGSPHALIEISASAVYWTNAWHNNYSTYLWVQNSGDTPIDWQVRIQLSAGATVTNSIAAERSYKDGIWTFTSAYGLLRPGHVYLFGFSGELEADRFELEMCSINGTPCQPFM